MLDEFIKVYDPADDNTVWFSKVKAIAPLIGFAAETSEYKKNPEAFKGNVSDIAEILRIAVTGKPNSPDLCSIMKILGGARSVGRMKNGRI